jgi:hypothetical protein
MTAHDKTGRATERETSNRGSRFVGGPEDLTVISVPGKDCTCDSDPDGHCPTHGMTRPGMNEPRSLPSYTGDDPE